MKQTPRRVEFVKLLDNSQATLLEENLFKIIQIEFISGGIM